MATDSTDQLSTMMDALTARVAVLDGQGLANNQKGVVPTIQANVGGVKAGQLRTGQFRSGPL